MTRPPFRRVVLSLLTLLALLVLSGCGTVGGPPVTHTVNKPARICMMPKLLGIPYFNDTRTGAEQAARELGVKLVYDGPVDASPVRQIDEVDQWITAGCDAITVSADDGAALAPSMSEAQHAGIATGAWDSDVTASARHVFVNQATFQSIGYGLADSMARATGAKGQFMVLTGSLTTPNTNMWISFLRERLKQKYPNMKIATVLPMEEDLQRGIDVTNNYLQANPHTTGVFGMVTTAIPAAAEAIQQLGLTGKVHAVGVGDANENRSYVLAGTTSALVIWNPIDLGYAAVYAANAEIHHQLTTTGSFKAGRLGTLKFDKPGELLLGPALIMTKHNIGQYHF
jgi:ABC-type sugar transport system substrate-binding protein